MKAQWEIIAELKLERDSLKFQLAECHERNVKYEAEGSLTQLAGLEASYDCASKTEAAYFLREYLEPVIKLLEDAQKVIDSGHFPTGVKEALDLLSTLTPRNE